VPELPEVEIFRRRLAASLVERRIDSVKVSGTHHGLQIGLDRVLSGRCVDRVERRGKFLLVRFDRLSLLVHLGMSGRFVTRTGARRHSEKHDHLELHLDDNSTVVFNDFRKFGRMWAVASDTLAHVCELIRLGPDPLEAEFNGEVLAGRLARRRASLKPVLLDQSVIAGLGNIYACESLWVARLDPFRLVSTLNACELAILADSIRSVLIRAIAAGGATLDDYRGTSGEMGDFDRTFAVFARSGLPCPSCGKAVSEGRLGGRNTYWCPRCQR
jgi:formamidopyrimidine-DNA glycosylase